jgi:hypothetical protein
VAPAGGRQQDKGAGEIVADLWQLCRDYAKQETIDPLKVLGRFVGYGIAGSLLLSLGILFGTLSVLRILQNETGSALTGSLDFIPYLAALVFATVTVVLAVSAIKRPMRAEEKAR